MTKQKVFIVDGGYQMGKWMATRCDFTNVETVQLGNWEKIFKNMVRNDIIVFEGGVDVDTGMYGQSRHPRTQVPDLVRDRIELNLFKKAMTMGSRVLGICRGAQITTVLAGGSLYQHIEGHRKQHSMRCQLAPDQAITQITTTSDHHQMMNPFLMAEKKYQILGWCEPPLSGIYFEGENSDPHINIPPMEPEVIWYPWTKALAIQAHPEWEEWNSPADLYYRQLVEVYLKVAS